MANEDFGIIKGYCKLAEALIYSAATPQDDEQARRNLNFARHSPIVEHYAHAFGFDADRIRDRLIEINLKKIRTTNK